MARSSIMAKQFQAFGFLSVLSAAAALILAFLCIFAGQKPGMMTDYAIFTLNTSQIGANLLRDINKTILSMNHQGSHTGFLREAIPPSITAALGLRDFGPIVNGLSSDVTGAASGIVSGATAVQPLVESDATSLASVATNQANSALGAAATAYIEAIDEAYTSAISDLDIKDFYSLHVMVMCYGTDANFSGNVPNEQRSLPLNTSSAMRSSNCEQYTGFDPMRVVRALYQAGCGFIMISLFLGIWGVMNFSKRSAIINFLGALPALLLIGFASATTDGIAVETQAVVDLIGDYIGIEGVAGRKFSGLSWTSTALLVVNAVVWATLSLV